MSALQNFRMLAGYNRWMNEKLYAVAASLDDAERKRNRGAFFRSVHGTLNHILLADRAWLARFHGMPITILALDSELFADFDDLRRERSRTDGEIIDWIGSLDDAALAAEIRYRTAAGREHAHPLEPALLHFFNHQSHHRGQLTTLLSQRGLDPGVTDVIEFYREFGR
jgi:uncharacterized damage-inducible protein DinB